MFPTKFKLYLEVSREADRHFVTASPEKSEWIVREYITRGGTFYVLSPKHKNHTMFTFANA